MTTLEKSDIYHQLCQTLKEGTPPLPDSGIFGADFPLESSAITLLGVPIDITTSSQDGTHLGPSALRQASHQLDLFDYSFGPTYRAGIRLEVLSDLLELNQNHRQMAVDIMSYKSHKETSQFLHAVNSACEKAHDAVYKRARELRKMGKLVGLIGGDHSTPYGLLKALAEEGSFGVLHIDAHHDLRKAYCGFTHSHASIFYNVLTQMDNVKKLVQVGIRDFSHFEHSFAKSFGQRVEVFYDEDLYASKARGQAFLETTKKIIHALPKRVYLSLDIDGLDRSYCPSTGTPVPGGLSYQEMVFLITALKEAEKELVGFDVVEVAPSQDGWDENVGARLVYKLCGLLAHSNHVDLS